eukprot:CAMPEP_0204636460 /NCGR_PEP_ID=MMETSP0717-20131115/34016_1 /ASSEMBLY_ACC=CAM_ASM_000666 /TAXON_ID=230516 /ORGANISM="Chaetoceros curvisetus" /LENGTH=52 /DNA_ID=CAMNT_0051655503 /DNA_START=111 /DNA_END=266 /DNA_ORIENTATION=+
MEPSMKVVPTPSAPNSMVPMPDLEVIPTLAVSMTESKGLHTTMQRQGKAKIY